MAVDFFFASDKADYLLATQSEWSEPEFESISPEELAREQFKDDFCQNILARLSARHQIPFTMDGTEYECFLFRKEAERIQIVIPASLQQRALHLSHHSKFGAHPGGRRLYTSLRELYNNILAIHGYGLLRSSEAL